MGGTRRSMEARRRAGKARVAARKSKGEAQLRPDRDGRFRVPCPSCGSVYVLAESALDARLTCKNCKSVFTPRTAAKRGRGNKQNPIVKPLIFGAVLIVVVVGLFAFSGRKTPPPQKPDTPTTNFIRMDGPQYQAMQRFAEAVHRKDELGLLAALDLAAHYDLVHRGSKPVAFQYLGPAEREAFRTKIVEQLLQGEEGLVFRDFEPTTIERKELPKEDTGKPLDFGVNMAPREQNTYDGYADVRVWTLGKGNTWKVLRWKLESMPKAMPQRTENEKKPRSRPPGVEKPEAVTVLDGEGKKVTMAQSKPVPLGHLEDTPEDLRRKIDAWIEVLMDSGADFRKWKDAENALVETGKPAIPRLLNKFYETRGTTTAEVEGLHLIAQILRRLSGDQAAFGFRPETTGGDAKKLAEMRENAMKGWYAWWYRNSSREKFPPPFEDEGEIK